jgi:hypothetical protein
MEDLFGINPNEKHHSDDYNNDDEYSEKEAYYEEIEDDEDDDEEEDKSDDDNETRVSISFACEDCDYRWDDVIVGKKDEIEREEFDMACPMCGSVMITQI